jgi:hypothetical protein
MLRFDACFFVRFSRGSSNGVFMGIKRATRQRPGTSAVGPCSTQLKKDTRDLKVGAYQQ